MSATLLGPSLFLTQVYFEELEVENQQLDKLRGDLHRGLSPQLMVAAGS